MWLAWATTVWIVGYRRYRTPRGIVVTAGLPVYDYITQAAPAMDRLMRYREKRQP
jgi:hypothetical protein